MIGELPDELLADHSGRAENAYVDSFGLHDLLFTARGAPPPHGHPNAAAALGAPPFAKKNPPAFFGPAGVVILL
jgi:hypothetical protein